MGAMPSGLRPRERREWWDTHQLALFAPPSWDECQRLGWGASRYCPAVACRYHVDCEETTCALRVANSGPQSLVSVAYVMGMSLRDTERVCQSALDKLFVAMGSDFAPGRDRRGGKIPALSLKDESRQAFVDFCEHANRSEAVPFGHGEGRRLSAEEIAAAYPGVRIARS